MQESWNGEGVVTNATPTVASRCERRNLGWAYMQMGASESQFPNYSRTQLYEAQEGAPYNLLGVVVEIQEVEILQKGLTRRWSLATAIYLRVLSPQSAPGGSDYPQSFKFAQHCEVLPGERIEKRHRSGRNRPEREGARQRIEGGKQQGGKQHDEVDAPTDQPSHEVEIRGYWEAAKNGFEVENI